MKLFSTNNKNNIVSLKEAVMQSMPIDKGLYMPQSINRLDTRFVNNIEQYSFKEIGFQIASTLFEDYIPAKDLWKIIDDAINFPAPVISLNDQISCLELFHGPSLAFKDFGARFMAGLMSYFNKDSSDKLTILVATSGDTGGAVAAGFLDTPGIEVIILYPKGRVSELQEKQLTTLGKNIFACEVKGDFDDCQRLVKSAFVDKDLQAHYNLSSANSINIARLIPQSFYYAEAYKQVKHKDNVCFCVPSGNLGNITAGLMAKNMGIPIKNFIAVTNANKVFTNYINSGDFVPDRSIQTISNAMDVSNPSNFSRIESLYKSNWYDVKSDITAFAYSDEENKDALKMAFELDNYVCDPHGALAYRASREYIKTNPSHHVVFLETAHPCKFIETVEESVLTHVEIPERLMKLTKRKKQAELISNEYNGFKSFLLERT